MGLRAFLVTPQEDIVLLGIGHTMLPKVHPVLAL